MTPFETLLAFPSEGDGVFVELAYGGEAWAYVQLENLDASARGSARVARARVVVELWPMRRSLRARLALVPEPPESFSCGFEDVSDRLEETRDWWPFAPARAMQELESARQLLLETEREREPIDDDGLTPLGRAFAKVPPGHELRRPIEGADAER